MRSIFGAPLRWSGYKPDLHDQRFQTGYDSHVNGADTFRTRSNSITREGGIVFRAICSDGGEGYAVGGVVCGCLRDSVRDMPEFRTRRAASSAARGRVPATELLDRSRTMDLHTLLSVSYE